MKSIGFRDFSSYVSHLKWAMNPYDRDYEAMQRILRCDGQREVMTFLNSYKETEFTDWIQSKLQLAEFLVQREKGLPFLL